MEKIAEGDPRALAQFINHLNPRLKAVLARLTDDPALVESALQQVLMTIVLTIGEFRRDP
jgi:DNA-directed RNA polymerase specialized sigma24 family protein